MATTSFFSSTGPTNTETDAIESSVSAAAASQAAAATSETNAAASEAAAASSASSASSSSSSATTAKTASETAKTASETAKTASEAARDLALTYRNAAQTASATATTKADEASTSATNSANSATSSASSASAASASQSAAASSATSAANSAATLTDERIQDIAGAQLATNGSHTGIAFTYDDAGDGAIDAVVNTSSLTETLTNKTLTSPVLNTGVSGTAIKDEDNMSSNSATHLATQQSIKAYVDAVAQTTEEVEDIVGNMVSNNTESGITVSYDDSNGNLDFTVNTLNQDTTGTAALATEITVSSNNSTDETVYPLFVDGATGSQGAESDTGLNYNPSSGILTATQFTGNLTGNVTGNVSGSSGSCTGNAATSTLASTVTVTDSTSNTNFPVVFHDESNALLDDTGALRYNPSTGTLLVPNLTVAGTTTQVNTITMEASNAIIFEGATPDNNETTLSIVDPTSDHIQYLINQGGYIPVLAAATTTAITSTPAELNILDGVTSTTAELNILDGVTSTAAELNLLDGSSAGNVVNSKAVIYGSGGELAGTLSTAAQTNVTSLGTLSSLTVSGDVTVDTNTLKVDSSNNRIGVNQASPDVSIDAGANTDAIHIPTGNTSQRPGSPANGYFRYNSETNSFEGYSNSEWGAIAGGGSGTNMDTNIYSGNGSTTAFTLSTACSDEQNLMVFIDGVFQAHDTYSVSGTTLTFATAPTNGRVITAYHSTTTVGGSNNTIATMTGDGSDTTLSLSVAPVHENNVQVFFDGIYQSKSNYSISGTTLTFSTAPPTGVLVEAITATNTDISTATQLVDSDSDTLIQCEESSDEDKIRFDTGGTERMVLDSTSLTVTPKIVSDAGIDIDNFNIDGTTIALSSGDMTLDSAGDIILDADGADVIYKDGGTTFLEIDKDNDNARIKNPISDGDIKIQGNDGGSIVTPLTLDMSVGGQVQITNPTNHPMTIESTATNGGYIEFLTAANGANMGYIGSANELINTGGNTDFGIRAQDEFYLSTGGSAARIKILNDGTLRLGNGLESAVDQTSSQLLGIQFGFSFGNIGLNLGCGSYTSNYDLMRFYNGNGQVGDIRVSGSATDFDTSSDYRLKENVTYDWDATTRLKQLKPARFNWIADDTNTPVDGFLAHEVSDIVPNAINGEKDAVYTAKDEANGLGKEGEPNMQGIDHSKLVPLLVKTIQELEARIKTLEDS